jgi:hypothetical protein
VCLALGAHFASTITPPYSNSPRPVCAQRTGVGPGKSRAVQHRTGGENVATRGAALEAPWGTDGLGRREPRDGARTAGRGPTPARVYAAYGGTGEARRRGRALERGRHRGVLNHLSVACLTAINSIFRNRSALRDE